MSSVSLKPNTLINSSLLLEEAYNTAFIVVDSEKEPPSQEETVERYKKELSMAEEKLALAEKKICGACLAIELQIFFIVLLSRAEEYSEDPEEEKGSCVRMQS